MIYRIFFKALVFSSILFISNFGYSQDQGNDISVASGDIKLTFVSATRTFELYGLNEGLILSYGIFKTRIGDRIIATNDFEIEPIIEESSDGLFALNFDGMLAGFRLLSDSRLEIYAEGENNGTIWFSARAPLSERTLGALLENEKVNDKKTVVQTLGVNDIPGLKSIYDPLKDLAIQIDSHGEIEWEKNYQWEFKTKADRGGAICTIKLLRHYYRDTLGIEYYAPIRKRSYFQKAPALAMTWVGIEGKFNRPEVSQRKEWLYPNIDWVSEHLLPYAGQMIFQLDDNYPIDDPQYMRDISDYIRSRDLIPGIWIAPFGVAPYELTKEHPEWFIHKADGTPITTFSGLSYDDIRHYNSAVLNVNSDEGVEKWFAGFLKQVNKDWNFDYYKVDGIPAALTVYRQSVDGGGVEGVRRGLQIFREVIGPDKYLNTCWGLPIEVVDIANGSRVGGDTEQLNQVISRVAVRQNYLNNVAWYADPDGAANMYASTTARARLNFLGRSLLGQPYVTDDNWTKVPDDILLVWQRTLPTIESFPTRLYKIDDPEEYDHFDLKIKRDWGEWDIVSLNNYENRPRIMTLDLGRFPLNADEVYVYDFWNQEYLGKHPADAKIARALEAIDAQCYSVVPVQSDRPVLISTSRHYTQGGIDIVDLKEWEAEKEDAWYVHGKSHQLVVGDPYELVFFSNGFDLNKAFAVGGSVDVTSFEDGIIRVKIIPNKTEADWKLVFVPGGPEPEPVVLEIPEPVVFRENIAPEARADASSIYFWGDQNGYGRPEGVNDGRTFRAWEAAEGETSGWIELVWEKPVTFDRILIDEWQESGGEIKSWVIEAGHKKSEYTPRGEKDPVISYDPKKPYMKPIASGSSIGRGFVIELKKPVTANALRLTIIESSERPGIWEIEVNPYRSK